MKLFTSAIVFLVVAVAPPAAATSLVPGAPVEAAVIPGCPTDDDGFISECIRRRAAWGAHLWETGEVEWFITSGSAVYNRFPEAEALKAALVHYGVPGERVFTETQALHTDENLAYSARLARLVGVDRLVLASDGMQVRGMMAMAGGFEIDARPMRIRYTLIAERLQEPLPEVRVEPVPAATWMPLKERERKLAEARGEKPRPSSFVMYGRYGLALDKGSHMAPVPPRPEPTLFRPRDDRAPARTEQEASR